MSNPFISIINSVLPEPQAGLLNGILFGTKANMSKSFYEILIITGTIHIVALSGQNISILLRIISDLTLRWGRKISIIISFFTVIGFVIFVGGQPSIIRAAIMGCMSLLAVYFGRQNWALLSLILAAGTMLIINPLWIGDLSFQLSFLATFGIIIFSKKYLDNSRNWKQELLRELKLSLRTSLSAQLFTVPLIFIIFKRISIVSPLTNILIGWVISPIMMLGFLVSFLGWIWLPLGQVVAYITWVPLTYLVKVIELTAKIPFASISF